MTYNPETHYPIHPQDNPYFVQQHGYLKRPQQSTLVGIEAAVGRLCNIKGPKAIKCPKRRPLPSNKVYNKSRPVVSLPVNRPTGKLTHTLRQKCGPSYFPVIAKG